MNKVGHLQHSYRMRTLCPSSPRTCRNAGRGCRCHLRGRRARVAHACVCRREWTLGLAAGRTGAAGSSLHQLLGPEWFLTPQLGLGARSPPPVPAVSPFLPAAGGSCSARGSLCPLLSGALLPAATSLHQSGPRGAGGTRPRDSKGGEGNPAWDPRQRLSPGVTAGRHLLGGGGCVCISAWWRGTRGIAQSLLWDVLGREQRRGK